MLETEDVERKDTTAARPRVLTADEAAMWEDELRGRLGLLPRGIRLPSRIRLYGWIVTAIATLVAAVTRLWNLSHPHAIVFDETYYVKGAYSLLHQGFEGTWQGDNANDLFLGGDFSSLSAVEPDYVVHPPFGKWIMAIGQAIFGSDDGLGWRFSTAILGIFAVFLIVRIAMRLFHSPLIAGFAGLAMALDGMGIVLSRTGILDNILSFLVLLGFYALLRDRDASRAELAHKVASAPLIDGAPPRGWGPRTGFRPWLIAAGIILGLSCGVKWSGIYAVAVFGILVFAWGVAARRAVGVRHSISAGIIREGLPAFLSLVPTALLAYLAAWTSWFLNPNSYDRQWAEGALARGETLPLSWAPNIINSFWHYHQSMWTFHTGLQTPHDYQSQAWEWIFQLRPVSFYWRGTEDMASECGTKECVQAITSIGNPVVWWFAVVALVLVIWVAFRERDWRAWAILAGYAAMWLPWLQYTHRTIFQFYAVAFLPYVVLCAAFGLAYLTRTLSAPHAQSRAFDVVFPPELPENPRETEISAAPVALDSTGAWASAPGDSLGAGHDPAIAEGDLVAEWATLLQGEALPSTDWWVAPDPDKAGKIAIGVVSGLVLVAALFWMPLWWGTTVSYRFWQLHMWTSMWI